MARKLRVEFPGAIYHVINRGNYRSWIFRDASTRAAFQTALFQACERSGWNTALQRALRSIGKTTVDARAAEKSASWKLAVAAWLKLHIDTSNRWAATALNLGVPKAASRNVTAFLAKAPHRNREWQTLKSLSET